MRSPLASGIMGALLLAGCQGTSAFNPEDPAVIAEIDSRLLATMDGAAKVDAQQVVAAVSDDATFVTGDVMLSGLANIRTQFADTYSAMASQAHTIRDKRVRILSPDVALVTVTGEGTYTDKAGWTSEPVGLALTIVYVRRDGAWRAVHAHQSIAD
jgi:uncharacterized protein (TIGR02246 family)